MKYRDIHKSISSGRDVFFDSSLSPQELIRRQARDSAQRPSDQDLWHRLEVTALLHDFAKSTVSLAQVAASNPAIPGKIRQRILRIARKAVRTAQRGTRE